MVKVMFDALEEFEDPSAVRGARRDAEAANQTSVPLHDEVIAVASLPGKSIHFDFSPKIADLFDVQGDFIAALPNGGKVILESFTTALSSAKPPLLWFLDKPLTVEEFLETQDGKLDIAPAGEAQDSQADTSSGGRNAYTDDFDQNSGETGAGSIGSQYEWSLRETTQVSGAGAEGQDLRLEEDPTAPESLFVAPDRGVERSAKTDNKGYGKDGKNSPKEDDSGDVNQAPVTLDPENGSVPEAERESLGEVSEPLDDAGLSLANESDTGTATVTNDDLGTDVDENADDSTLVRVAVAVDPELGDTHTYKLLDDSGTLLDYEADAAAVTTLDAQITALEEGTGEPPPPPPSPPLSGDTWYVRPVSAGVSGDGTSYDNAWSGWSSIDWGAIQPGDMLYIAGVMDGPPFRIFASGAEGRPITIRGDYPGDPGTLARPNGDHIIDTNSHNYLHIMNIHLMQSTSRGINIWNSHDVIVDNVEVEQVEFGVSIRSGSENILIKDSHIHDVGNGIYSFRYAGINNALTITGNLIEDVGQNPAWSGNDRHGIGLQDGDDHLVDGNTIQRSSGSGITMWKADGSTMQNMVITNNVIEDIHNIDTTAGLTFRGIEISGQNNPAMEDWAGLVISGNHVSDVDNEGIYWKGPTPIIGAKQTITNNTVEDSGMSFGFSEHATPDGTDIGFDLTGNVSVNPISRHFDYQHKSAFSFTYNGVVVADNTWNPENGTALYEWRGVEYDTYDSWIAAGGSNSAPTAITLDNQSVDENAAGAITIDLLNGNSDQDGNVLAIARLDQPNSGTVIDNGDGTVTYRPAETFSLYDSFSYSVADGSGGISTAQVHIWDDSLNPVTGTKADETLNGTSGGDYIAGSSGDDSLFGNDGNDVLLGGGGSDELDGGAGNDVMIGGVGADTIEAGQGTNLIVYESILDGGDTINGFSAANGLDIISLDSLLDSLGVATSDRPSRIAVEKNNDAHTLRVDTIGDGSFDLVIATVNIIDGNILDIGQDGNDVSYGTLG